MDLKFSKMSVDTTLAQEYLNKNGQLLELYNDYNGTIEKYAEDGEDFMEITKNRKKVELNQQKLPIFRKMASKLEQNANLIAQLEYYTRNIPIEETHTQLNLIIQYFRCQPYSRHKGYNFHFQTDDSLLAWESLLRKLDLTGCYIKVTSKEPVAICDLFEKLLHEAGASVYLRIFKTEQKTEDVFRKVISDLEDSVEICPVNGLDSGTVAVVSDDADVDSAVDKFVSVSKQAPWRLTRILVQESVYQLFKDALTWKCKLNESGTKPPTSEVLCSNTLTYNDRTFLIDPVGLTEEQPSPVTVEAYRTTKEMISLLQQYKPRYLSLWINGVAEINEVTHSTKAPVVWVNNVADFRGPPQISEAVFSYVDDVTWDIVKCDKVAKLCELSQSWLKLDFESRRDILCDVLDKYLSLDPANKLYIEIRNSLSSSTPKSFVDVGKDYVCTGLLQPMGIMGTSDETTLFSITGFESILQGNALIATGGKSSQHYSVLEQVGVPVIHIDELDYWGGDFEVFHWVSSYFMRTRVIWTNSGTIFAN